jgi:uncharacterized membrane protein
LTPHRAMDQKGIRRVIAFTAIMASIPGITFYAMGAWPVVGLLGLDVLLLWWAMSASLKSGGDFEEITLWPDALDIRKVSANGRASEISFNPFFVRLSVERSTDDQVTAIRLVSRERQTEIGKFLTPYDKGQFAAAFANALYRAKR